MRKSKAKATFGLYIFFLLLMAGAVSAVWAQIGGEDEEDSIGGVRAKGVYHNIATDRQITKVSGVYEPEGLDIYLKRHLDAMSGRINELEGDVEEVKSELRAIHALLLEEKGKA